MKTTRIIGFAVLVILWIWLAWGVLSAGLTLYNLLIVAFSGIIILFVLYLEFGLFFKEIDARRK